MVCVWCGFGVCVCACVVCVCVCVCASYSKITKQSHMVLLSMRSLKSGEEAEHLRVVNLLNVYILMPVKINAIACK